jgi:hypothetical protein
MMNYIILWLLFINTIILLLTIKKISKIKKRLISLSMDTFTKNCWDENYYIIWEKELLKYTNSMIKEISSTVYNKTTNQIVENFKKQFQFESF